MTLQVIIKDVRSAWKFNGPIYKSEGGYNATELFNIIIGDCLLNLAVDLPVFHTIAIIPDCAQENMSLIRRLMGLHLIKKALIKVVVNFI